MGAPREFPIRDYGIIGNCETAALVSKEGGIDWLCLPAFDASSFFGALLDRERTGDGILKPTQFSGIEQRYLGDTAILETIFYCDEYHVLLTDFFVLARQRCARFYDFTALEPTRKLVRRVSLRGAPDSSTPPTMTMRLAVRPDYGRQHAEWKEAYPGKSVRGYHEPQRGSAFWSVWRGRVTWG